MFVLFINMFVISLALAINYLYRSIHSDYENDWQKPHRGHLGSKANMALKKLGVIASAR